MLGEHEPVRPTVDKNLDIQNRAPLTRIFKERSHRIAKRSEWVLAIFGAAVALLGAAAGAIITWKVTSDASTEARTIQWRQALHPKAEVPGADLTGLTLNGVYAPESDLAGMTGIGADLSNTTFVDSTFDSANLANASFDNAHLDGAAFRNTDLRTSTFTGASLATTNFRNADLRGADFEGATFWQTDFSAADLSDATILPQELLGACWDAETKWPAGLVPGAPRCSNLTPVHVHGIANPTSVQFAVRTQLVPKGDPWGATMDLNSSGKRFEQEIRFSNEGAVTIDNVVILVDLGNAASYVRPTAVRLVNGNYPNGYYFHNGAIQDQGRQINVDIGSYSAHDNAFLIVEYIVKKKISCTRQPVMWNTYAKPAEYGAIVAKSSVYLPISYC